MNPHGIAFTYKLCGAVDPSVRQPELYAALIEGMSFDLRLVYIADDDLGFINHCIHQYDEFAANMHREPYHSLALSNSGQAFIISMNHEAVCVAELHHALQYDAGDEIIAKEGDYFVKLFFSNPLQGNETVALLHFLTAFCRQFEEVSGLIIKADNPDAALLVQSGFVALEDAGGVRTGTYYYSTSKENV